MTHQRPKPQHRGIHVRPDPETKAVLERYGALLNMPVSRLVADLLGSQRDVLSQMADIHEQALKLKKGQADKIVGEIEELARSLGTAGKRSSRKKTKAKAKVKRKL